MTTAASPTLDDNIPPQLKADLEKLKVRLRALPPEQAERRQREALAAAERERQRRIAALRQSSEAPLRHMGTDPVLPPEVLTKLTTLKSLVGTGMLVALVGVRGNGKTQVAVEVIRFVTGQERSALFTTAMAFFVAVKDSFRRDSTITESRVLAKYRAPSLLVIDEIGKRSENDWENNLLFEVINSRYNDRKDTIVIDNRDPADFEAAIGPSLVSRMIGAGGIMECNWESVRKPGANN